jgi:hypothetical protein
MPTETTGATMTITEFCDKFGACREGREWALANCEATDDELAAVWAEAWEAAWAAPRAARVARAVAVAAAWAAAREAQFNWLRTNTAPNFSRQEPTK